MSIPNNEIWAKGTTSIATYYYPQKLVSTTINNEGWTVFRFDSELYTIYEDTFSGDSGLTEVIIPASVTLIGRYAFNGCKSLTHINIPASVTQIGGYAFRNCTSLSSITCLSATQPLISDISFYNVTWGGTFTYPEGADYSNWHIVLGLQGWNQEKIYFNPLDGELEYNAIAVRDYMVTFNESEMKHTLLKRETRKNLSDDSIWYVYLFDEPLYYIEANFIQQYRGTHIVLPASVIYIGVAAFTFLEKCEAITCYAPTAPRLINNGLVNDVFSNIKKNGVLYYPEGSDYSSWLLTDKYYLGYYGWTSQGIEVKPYYPSFPDRVVENNEIWVKSKYTTHAPPNGNIYDSAGRTLSITETYVNDEGWTVYVFDGNIYEIGDSAFKPAYSSVALGDIKFPRGLVKIGADAFRRNLFKYIVIPNSVTHIGVGAFESCTCDVLFLGTGLKTLEDEAFAYLKTNLIISYSPKAASVTNITFAAINVNGVLVYPEGSDYSTWLSSSSYYLGYYGWNGHQSNMPVFIIEYNNIEAPAQGLVTTLGVTAKSITEIFVIHPQWTIPTEMDDYFAIDIQENEGLTRTGEMVFTAIATQGETFEQTLNIRQIGIKDMATSIALYKTRLDFPGEGGSLYVQVDYINAQTINTPYCSQSWVTIQQTQAGTAIDGSNTIYQRMYKITMNPTTFARQVNVKFSCTSATGAEISTDKLYLYQAAPTGDYKEPETHAFVTQMKVKIDGTPDMSSYTSIRCGYNSVNIQIPIVDGDWIHLGDGYKLDTTSTYDDVYEYPISFDANTGIERVGTVTFYGWDSYGNVVSDITTITQLGSDTPVDEGMITLKSLSVTLPATGGSDTFMVEYYDAKTIDDPVFDGDWATITEIASSTSAGTAWNGTECMVTTKTYRVTAQATDAGRVAKVILKAKINYYDGGTISMEKDKFRVYQMAPGSEEFKGIVYPFRNELTYDHKGYSTSWGSVRVGYKDVAIGTPTLDSNWLSVKEIKDVTYSSKEYDKIYEYTFTLNENIASVSRTAIVTFIGENEDGSKSSAKVSIVQSSYQSDIDTVATNYKGYFKSMDGTLYSVAFISDPNYDSYGEITLAGESPVTVSYTDSDRLYEPVRTSTCTIRVVTTQYLMNLYSGKAHGTQVIVKDEDTGLVKWCGFLQPNLYNQGYSADIEEIEFEASDCLSSLQYFKYEDYYSNGRMSVPFSYVIGDMMDKCKLINSYYITKKQYSDNIQSKDLKFNSFFIAEHNFFSEEEEPWTLQEVLEETCKFFGYVCYQWGDSVFFMDYDFYNSDKSMYGYRYDKEDSWSKSNYVQLTSQPNTITAGCYRDTGGNMSLDDVFNKVTVNCNYYNIEEIIPDLFDDENLTNRMDNEGYFRIRRYTGTGNSILSNETYYRIYDHKNINSLYYVPLEGTSVHESKATPTADDLKGRNILEDYVGANIIDMIHLGYNEANGKVGESKDWERYLMISQLNRPWCGAEGTFHWENYNFPVMEFKNLPTIFLDNRQESTGRPGTKVKPRNYFVIDAQAAFVALKKDAYLSDGQVKGMDYIRNISCYKYMDNDNYVFDHVRGQDDSDPPALCFYLEIPKKGWWNGSGWVDYKTHFEVPLETLNYEDGFWATSKGVKNTVESNLFIGASGYKIPLPEEMDSTEFMYFAIAMPKRTAHLSDSRGGDYTGVAGNAYCFIKDLKLSICNLYSSLWEDKDMIYENIIDEDNVIDGDEIDLKITSDNGYNYSLSNVAVMTSENRAETEFRFYNRKYELMKPEEAIIERYVNQYSTPSIKEEITVDLSFLPHQLIWDSYWEKDFVIVGQEIDYKNDRQTIKLLQKK